MSTLGETIASLITASIIFLVLSALMGIFISWLWNIALVPAIDGVNMISIWQAIGISILTGLLFKSNVSIKKTNTK